MGLQIQPLAPDARGVFEARIRALAPAFDLMPLLRLLEAKGYERERILFQSNGSDTPNGALIQAIDFPVRSGQPVLITLNLGLLGPGGLLPSYFYERVERSDHAERFYDFVRFFDHALIGNYLRALYPEEQTELYGDYPRVLHYYFRMLGVRSLATLHWLFSLYFPELTVSVRREEFPQATTDHGVRTGETPIDGSGILGQRYDYVASGFHVDLYGEYYHHDNGRPWPVIASERLFGRLLPILREHQLPLRVLLHIESHSSWARLQRGPALGYERVVPEAAAAFGGGARSYEFTVPIFEGSTADAKNSVSWVLQRYFPDFPLRVSEDPVNWANLDRPNPEPAGMHAELFVDLDARPVSHWLEAFGEALRLGGPTAIPSLVDVRQALAARLADDLGRLPLTLKITAHVRPRPRGLPERDERVLSVVLYQGRPGERA